LIPPGERSFAENPFRRLGSLTPNELFALQAGLKQRLLDPDVLIRETPLGLVRRLAPAVTYSDTPASWNDPILTPMGASSPTWLGTTVNSAFRRVVKASMVLGLIFSSMEKGFLLNNYLSKMTFFSTRF